MADEQSKGGPAGVAAGPAAGAAEQTQRFEIQKIYVKNLSFETPNSPQVFREQWQPSVHLDLANAAQDLGDDLYEVTLTITTTVSAGEKTIYLVEVQQSGIFLMTGFSQEERGRAAATVCPNILFPFARELVSDLATRAGFPQMLLAPMNFESLYLQAQQQAAAKQAQQADGDSDPQPATH